MKKYSRKTDRNRSLGDYQEPKPHLASKRNLLNLRTSYLSKKTRMFTNSFKEKGKNNFASFSKELNKKREEIEGMMILREKRRNTNMSLIGSKKEKKLNQKRVSMKSFEHQIGSRKI